MNASIDNGRQVVSPALQEILREIAACPLCGDARVDARSTPEANLYSEQLSLLLGCDEAALLDAVENHRCASCGLWYKTRWFPSSALAELFRARVPDHPKGWDAVSDRFSEHGFATAVRDLRFALDAGKDVDQSRTRRALGSIVDSLQLDDGNGLRARLQQAISTGDTAALEVIGQTLAPCFAEPAPFRRFSGFSSPLLWDWMIEHVGPVSSYGEIGCPLWGQLMRPATVGVQRWYFARAETNYWGRGCRRDGCHCSARLAESSGVNLRVWPPAAGEMLDAVGAFQYLDHLEAPAEFVADVFEHSRSLLLVLDEGSAPIAIQHVTGWDMRSLGWLARRHGKRIVDDFAPIRGSGNHAWLLCDD